jgi:hypothetical protein
VCVRACVRACACVRARARGGVCVCVFACRRVCTCVCVSAAYKGARRRHRSIRAFQPLGGRHQRRTRASSRRLRSADERPPTRGVRAARPIGDRRAVDRPAHRFGRSFVRLFVLLFCLFVCFRKFVCLLACSFARLVGFRPVVRACRVLVPSLVACYVARMYGGGASPVPVQMWAGRAQSRCRCGRGEPSPSADVGRGEPSCSARVQTALSR